LLSSVARRDLDQRRWLGARLLASRWSGVEAPARVRRVHETAIATVAIAEEAAEVLGVALPTPAASFSLTIAI